MFRERLYQSDNIFEDAFTPNPPGKKKKKKKKIIKLNFKEKKTFYN